MLDKNDTILVTGAGGLVGSHVVELLEAEGFRHVFGLRHVDCDLTNRMRTEEIFRMTRPKHVFHAAARVYGIKGNMDNQGKSYLDNTLINTHVIDAAKKYNAEKITVMGTGAVYPVDAPGYHRSGERLAYRESHIFNGRPDPHEAGYAHAKRGMLAMLEAYQTSYGLKWAYIVSCNLFGPRDKFEPINGHVTPALIHKFYMAKELGTPITVWGDGSAERDFLYVKDAARVAKLAMDGVQGPINMGSGQVYRIRDVVDALSDISGVTDIQWDDTKPNGVAYRAYDLGMLRQCGFAPMYTLRAGLQETWDWYCQDQRIEQAVSNGVS